MIETVWFILLFGSLATYVVLGGTDLGVGIVHFLVGKNDDERWQMIRTIRPVWKPNEVWLVASSGTMFLAFPIALATSFSGFYLPLMIVLWLLVFRGLGIELRYHIPDRMWVQACDFALCASSLLLALCLGAALGNVVRGVSLDAEGIFFAPLWTDFLVGQQTGILDWYTTLVGITAVLALALHGALWLSANTDGDVRHRATLLAGRLWYVAIIAYVIITICSFRVQPMVYENVNARPWGIIFPNIAFGSLFAAHWIRSKGRSWAAYVASCVSLYAMFATVAVSIYPNILPGRNPDYALSLFDAAAPVSGLRTGLLWWIPGMLIVVGYFGFIFSKMPKTVSLSEAED